ncbi:hypothetical protein BJX68DRAFT_258008 [Aspergillus pseudodeflectus]|uniref:Uncharacterized protein n=1 Tax=Aspergillus pseudodeflectus TaxID=176178 RepID=A0ABR4JP76_9EURO
MRRGIATVFKFSPASLFAGAGGWHLWTGRCYFEPFGPSNDPLFESEYFKQFNPGNHPSIDDSCVRKVPLSQIPAELVADALAGGSKLLERFCAGIWGGYGYSIQRNILARVARNESNAESILWDKEQLLQSTYEKGTIVTDHFIVSPSTNPNVRREMENLSELSVDVVSDTDKGEGVVEFRMKNIFYNGAERMPKPLFPAPIVWLHLQYCKLLVEGGVSHCVV